MPSQNRHQTYIGLIALLLSLAVAAAQTAAVTEAAAAAHQVGLPLHAAAAAPNNVKLTVHVALLDYAHACTMHIASQKVCLLRVVTCCAALSIQRVHATPTSSSSSSSRSNGRSSGSGSGSSGSSDISLGAARTSRSNRQLRGFWTARKRSSSSSSNGRHVLSLSAQQRLQSRTWATAELRAKYNWPSSPFFDDPWVLDNIAVTYGHRVKDGIGSQVVRMIAVYALANITGMGHLFRPLGCVGHIGGHVHYRWDTEIWVPFVVVSRVNASNCSGSSEVAGCVGHIGGHVHYRLDTQSKDNFCVCDFDQCQRQPPAAADAASTAVLPAAAAAAAAAVAVATAACHSSRGQLLCSSK
jgi:hypothetical protein